MDGTDERRAKYNFARVSGFNKAWAMKIRDWRWTKVESICNRVSGKVKFPLPPSGFT
jgi:hypothetical protein